MEALLLMIMGLTNIACFMIGVNVRQKVDKGEEVKLQIVKPAKAVPVQTEEDVAKSRFDTIMQNIDNYDGTEYGQVDVPAR